MIINPYTKEAIDFEFVPEDLCEYVEVNDKVKEIYYKYKGKCEKYLTSVYNADNVNHRYYVYAWHTKTEPKRYFYVGKGTGSRYKHIISDINKYKNGKQNLRFKRYSQIQDKWGIDCEIIIKNLTQYEALIYEECQKLEFLCNGEVLLNYEGIPDEYIVCEENIRTNIPMLDKSLFFERYFDDYNIPHFDEVNEDNLMRTYIYPYFLDCSDETVANDKEIILDWLKNRKATIYKTVSKKTKSVIVQGYLPYNRYLEYRGNDKKIFSSKDVLTYIGLKNKEE